MATERFIKLKSGACYPYSERLAKRKDAQIVDGYTAARYFRNMGVTSRITEEYPEREIDKGISPDKGPSSRGDASVKARAKPKTKPKAKAKAKPKPKAIPDDVEPDVSDVPSEVEEALVTDVEDLLSGN